MMDKDERARLTNPERVRAYLDELEAVSRKYGLRMSAVGEEGPTIVTVEGNHGLTKGRYFVTKSGLTDLRWGTNKGSMEI